MQNVIKWLLISLFVLFGFTIVLLGLGSLLHENEQRVTAIKTGLSSTKVTETTKLSSPIRIQTTPRSTLKPIIKQNLTCVMDEQCVIVEATFTDISCAVAINTIGAAKLAKAEPDNTMAIDCPRGSDNAVAVCRNNLCILADSTID